MTPRRGGSRKFFQAVTWPSPRFASLRPMPNGHRVLVIEDEADLRALLAYNLEAWGYEVRAVEGGKAGLRLFEEFSPDLVLLDLMLPDISGIEVCRKLRGRQDVQPPIIFMLTAPGDEIDGGGGIAGWAGCGVGPADFLVNPFSVRELMLRMNARLKPRGGDASPRVPA